MPQSQLDLFITSFGETLLMISVPGLLGTLLGGVLGLFLHLAHRRVLATTRLSRFLRLVTRCLRSTPSIIILAAFISAAHMLLGGANGLSITITPLVVIATSFVAHYVETAMNNVNLDIIETAHATGASCRKVICQTLIPKAAADIISGLGTTLTSLVGFSALAGAIGGGGLGELCIKLGYANNLPDVMLAAVIMLVALAETCHVLGHALAQRLNQQ